MRAVTGGRVATLSRIHAAPGPVLPSVSGGLSTGRRSEGNMGRSKFSLGIAGVVGMLALGSGTSLAAVNQWNISSGLCGNVQAVAVQRSGTTERVFVVANATNVSCAGVFRSTNNGQSFTKVGITIPGYGAPNVYDVKANGARVYVATSRGVWTTTDLNSITWTQNFGGLPDFAEITAVNPLTLQVYATVSPSTPGGTGGLWRSTDQGVNWTQVKPGLNVKAMVDTVFGCGNPYASTWIFATDPDGGGGLPSGLWYSQDSGVTWNQMTGFPTAKPQDVEVDCNNFTGNYQDIFVSSRDPNFNVAMYRSTDFGVTFQPDNQGIPGCCAFTTKPTIFSGDYYAGSRIGSNGTAMYERTPGGPLGSPWVQFTTLGLPGGTLIFRDWDVAYKPGTTNKFRRIAVVWNGSTNATIYYYEPA